MSQTSTPRPSNAGWLAKSRILWLSTGALAIGAGVFGDYIGQLVAATPPATPPNGTRLVGWNNLGMHCTDGDFSVFSILPPYNTLDSQLIVNGILVKNDATYTVTYEAVADPSGSINTTSINKDNFWQNSLALFGVALAPDTGLAGTKMPGTANVPQPTTFDGTYNTFHAEGIPITPYDDGHVKNFYPMVRLAAKNKATGTVIATTDIVLPVSDEIHCSQCHSSGADFAAQPPGGYVYDTDPLRDYRLNILKLHDGKQIGKPVYNAALAAMGYNPLGLYANVIQNASPILCSSCHGSVALGTPGYPGIPPLTAAVHGFHAGVVDPTLGLTLDDLNNRTSCYRCHPGSITKCLRGAMGAAVASDGSMLMQCQSCHGNMSKVGDPNRTGWLQEPNCQMCHTGTATHNNGQIRYTSVFEPNGDYRVAVDSTFATNANTPGPGLSLYRFSKGHGGLQCEACHGSTHAEYPSTHVNDNVQNIAFQGHKGMLVECSVCHVTVPNTVTGGPHGMHPIGDSWVDHHPDVVEANGSAQCRACHGTDYRGTVLSYAQGERALATKFGTKNVWRGFQIGCYNCHNGPSNENPAPNTAPTVQNINLNSNTDVQLVVTLLGSDVNTSQTLTYRIVSQVSHGTVALAGNIATYFPDPGFAGIDSFTYAVWDGFTNSNLGVVRINVSQPALPPGIVAYGSGTPGCSGSHELRANSSATIGNSNFQLTCSMAPADSLGLGIITDSQSLGGDPFGLGVNLLIDFFAATEAITTDFLSNGVGYGIAPAAIPNDPNLVGRHYYAQALWVWIWPCSPSLYRLSTSNGLDILVMP